MSRQSTRRAELSGKCCTFPADASCNRERNFCSAQQSIPWNNSRFSVALRGKSLLRFGFRAESHVRRMKFREQMRCELQLQSSPLLQFS
jgi:hypothetical protein